MNRSKLDEIINDKIPAHDKRTRPLDHKWYGITIHHTGVGNQTFIGKSETWIRNFNINIAKWLAKKDEVFVSAHYQIGYYGEIIELVDPFKDISFHAGKSQWFHPGLNKVASNVNDFQIGIELLGDGNKFLFTEDQYSSLAKLTRVLIDCFPSICPTGITGHDRIAPGRKDDPGKFFDWQKYFKLIYKENL